MFNMGMSGNKFNNSFGSGVSINTTLYISFSDTAQLTVRGWNEQLSLKFAPFKGVDMNGRRQYAQDRNEVISTSLTKDNAITLVEGIKENIFPALKNKTSASVTVTMGSDESKKAMTVLTDGENVTLKLSLGVNNEGVVTGDSITHQFNKREYIVGYEPSTGKGESVVQINSDFMNFYHILDSAKDLNQINVHNTNYGASIKSSFPQNNSYGQNSNGYNNPAYNGMNNKSSNTTAPAPAQVTSYNSMDDFLPFN